MNSRLEISCEDHSVPTAPSLKDLLTAQLSPYFPKGAQVAAAFAGSLTLIVGTDYGADQVLPTLLSGDALGMAGTLVGLATLLLCAFSVANVADEATRVDSSVDDTADEATELATEALELQSRTAVLTGMLAIPGLGGAYLAGSGTAALLGDGFFGALFGLAVGVAALGSIAFTAWTAAAPDPVLAQLVGLPRRASEVRLLSLSWIRGGQS